MIIPTLERRRRPRVILVRVTGGAGIGDIHALTLRRSDEPERVAGDIHFADGLGDLGHMTGHTLAARAAKLVMGMFLNARRMRPILRIWAVAGRANLRNGLAQHGLILCAMWIVAAETGNATIVHQALGEIVALHPVLVRRAIREMREAGFTQLMLFQLPVIRKLQSCAITDRPVVIFPLDRIR